eukprot:2140599-Pyramimonas_sp.AAC.1
MLEAVNTQAVAAKMADPNNQYLEELKSHEEARSSLQRMQSSSAKCPPAKPTGTNVHLLSAAQSSGTASVPLQSDLTNVVSAGASALLVREVAQSPPAERGETPAESSIVA